MKNEITESETADKKGTTIIVFNCSEMNFFSSTNSSTCQFALFLFPTWKCNFPYLYMVAATPA
jgi:hypothetical protein